MFVVGRKEIEEGKNPGEAGCRILQAYKRILERNKEDTCIELSSEVWGFWIVDTGKQRKFTGTVNVK